MSTPLWPEELVSTGTERDVLEAFLDCQRRQIVAKVAGVPEEAARRRVVPSKTTPAGFALDDTVPSKRLGEVSLRWIYAHMIEETAQHAGHADILRELTDGATGL